MSFTVTIKIDISDLSDINVCLAEPKKEVSYTLPVPIVQLSLRDGDKAPKELGKAK